MSEGPQQDPPGGPPPNPRPRFREGGLLEHLLKIRYVAAVVVILSLLHSLTFLFIGARIALVTYWQVLRAAGGEEAHEPGMALLHSLDYFLVSLVLMILGLGVAKLFLLPSRAQTSFRPPSWLDIGSFSDLKFLLWETILTTLLIVALPIFTAGLFGNLEWSALVTPVAIVLLAFSLYLMKKT
jgi:uncharacterized membrane protein YqhA